ncbi:MAG: hypothetical protein GVY29_01695 [Spirochaetes bacterium]|nr:hypothetical protein [Spirochaetota bacterium]
MRSNDDSHMAPYRSGALEQEFVAAGAHILSGLAAIEARRASRAQILLEDLEVTLGAAHLALVRRKDQLELGKASALGLRTQAERLKRRPTIGDGQSLVYGRVWDSEQRPAPGVHLSLFREEEQAPVAERVSDEYGDFAIVVCVAPSGTATASPSAWRLKVTVYDETLLFSSDRPFQLAPGASVYLDIHLSQEAPSD